MNRMIRMAVALLVAGFATQAYASSHREAPGIAEDQYADNTDVYTFISPTDPDRIVFVANYVPLLLPSSGPNFYRFSDNARYEIRIDNDGDARPDLTYRYTFKTGIENGNTFLYNVGPISSIDDLNLNVKQVYTLVRIDHRTRQRQVIVRDQPVAPWHVGKRSFPNDSYETVARQAIYDNAGVKSFAGPRDEPFFVDLQVFDLLGVAGVPTTDGINVMSLVLEVPITDVVKDGVRTDDASSMEAIVGVYARTTRPRARILNRGVKPFHFGRYLQVSRLGWPLVNEVIIPLVDKDSFNLTSPVNDVAFYGQFILDPEVPKLLTALQIAECPPAPADGRLDIVGLLSPNGTAAADLLRVNVAQGQTYANVGFPNGRRLEDDVTDTLLTVACNNGSAIGDGVDANDLAFTTDFPYLASPHSGNP